MKICPLENVRGQSAVEYLTTYGWAFLGLVVAGGVVASLYSSGCPVKVTTEANNDLTVVDAALTADGDLELALESQVKREVRVDSVSIGGGDVVRDADILLQPGSKRRYMVAEAGESRCVEKEIDIVYDKGPLEDINVSGTVQAPRTLVEAVADFLRKRGDEINRLEVNSSVMLTGQKACLGDLCPGETAEVSGRVERSGDQMEGYLQTRRLDFKCFGNRCEHETGVKPGYVSSTNYTMDGTLNITEVTTENSLCLGNCTS